MKEINMQIKTRWRVFTVGMFVLLVFTFPATKGFFGKLFGFMVHGAQQHKNNLEITADFSSGGAPRSRPVAGPIQNGDSCSTGRQHTHSHHNHHRDRHSHYH
jgi:hypothetical protein